MNSYIRKINYYETDKMGITHHSNYVRFMEEARIDFLESVGLGYEKMEEMGIVSPVIGIECEYKSPTTFGDILEISIKIAEYKRLKLTVCYEIINQNTGKTVLLGKSHHCFTDKSGKMLLLSKSYPEIHLKLSEYAENKD